MNERMALLILLWQEACLEHDVENDELLRGSRSATLAEEAVLDRVKEEFAAKEKWEDFNSIYLSFPTALARLQGCVEVLSKSSEEFKKKTIELLEEMARASSENNSDSPISGEEAKFIATVKAQLGC